MDPADGTQNAGQRDEDRRRRAQATPTIRDYLARNRAPACSACGEAIGGVPEDVVAVVCSRCTAYLAELAKHRRSPSTTAGRECPECGGPLAVRKRVCGNCRARRRRETYRRSRTRRRSTRNS